MRYIFIFILIISTLMAENKNQKVTIGLGPYIQTQPYKNVDNILIASPVIFFDNSVFYIRWSRAGIYFLGSKEKNYAWGLSLTTQPRVYGYEANEIQGMDERKTTWEGGIAFSAKTKNTYIEIMALTDILDRYNSWILKTEFGYDLKFGDFLLYPSMIIIYQTDNFLNYYYGVKKDEELNLRKEYIPNHGLQLGIQTYIKYPITNNLSTLINLRVDRLSKEATHSPIVNEDYIYSALASIIYTFKY